MDTHLLRIPVRRQRDALLARRQVRPVARLLGFDAAEQACIAGLVFELAPQALTQAARSVERIFPRWTAPGPRLQLQQLTLPTGRNGCNDFLATNADDCRLLAA